MKVLILGGAQASGPGLRNGKSYLAQFIRRLRVTRQLPEIDQHFVTITEAISLLPSLHLADYDLILLQFDPSLDWLPVDPVSRLIMQAKLWVRGSRLARLNDMRQQLAQVLLEVRVYNRQVVLMSPLPHGRGLEEQFLQLAQAVYVRESREWQVPLFDVSQHLSGGDYLFQAESTVRLSEVAHEVLGSELHTFITEPTYTLWS